MKSKWPAIPYVLWSAAFVVLPLLLVVYAALTDADGNFSLVSLSQVPQYSTAFVRSIVLATFCTGICFILAYPFAYILSRITVHRQAILYMLAVLPMWMNFLLRTYSWMTLLENTGLINQFLGIFGIGPFQMINTQGAILLGMVYDYLPFMILPLYSIMTKIDSSMIEAAQDLGCSPFEVIRRVVFPLSMPGIRTGIIMVFVPAVSTFIISKLLGGGKTLLIGDLIENQFLGNSYNMNLGSAMSLVLMVIVLVIISLTGSMDGDEMGGLVR